jgi:death-on-curing protein
MGVVYLPPDQIRELHDDAVKDFGGIQGMRSEQSFLSAVYQPQQSAFGEDAYATVSEKAAAYGFFLAEGQPFIDGNKRTAALAMLTFLELNGLALVADDDQIAGMFENLGNKSIDQSGFFAWACDCIRPVA